MLLDPKRVKRILANRESAARSKVSLPAHIPAERAPRFDMTAGGRACMQSPAAHAKLWLVHGMHGLDTGDMLLHVARTIDCAGLSCAVCRNVA